jgi:hypothetical protein
VQGSRGTEGSNKLSMSLPVVGNIEKLWNEAIETWARRCLRDAAGFAAWATRKGMLDYYVDITGRVKGSSTVVTQSKTMKTTREAEAEEAALLMDAALLNETLNDETGAGTRVDSPVSSRDEAASPKSGRTEADAGNDLIGAADIIAERVALQRNFIDTRLLRILRAATANQSSDLFPSALMTELTRALLSHIRDFDSPVSDVQTNA